MFNGDLWCWNLIVGIICNAELTKTVAAKAENETRTWLRMREFRKRPMSAWMDPPPLSKNNPKKSWGPPPPGSKTPGV